MALGHLLGQFGTLSTAMKIGIAVAVLAVVGLLIGGTASIVSGIKSRSYAKQAEKLEQENRQLTDQYNEAIGKAKAFEQTAREEKAKADAIIATIEAGTKNVKALDDKLEQVNQKYDKAKSELGDCADTGDCLKRLCLELKAAGFKTPDCN